MENPWADPKIIEHCRLLSDSFYKWLKKPLHVETADDRENSFLLYHAPFIVVSHGTETDPIFNYANDIALQTWGMTWFDFVVMPSKHTVEPVEVTDRESLLSNAKDKGFVYDYKGVRINKKGKKFKIVDTILWNLEDKDGNYKGQAAIIPKWEFL